MPQQFFYKLFQYLQYIVVTITLCAFYSTYAANVDDINKDALPDLPKLEQELTEQANNTSQQEQALADKSFWQKIKSFFGAEEKPALTSPKPNELEQTSTKEAKEQVIANSNATTTVDKELEQLDFNKLTLPKSEKEAEAPKMDTPIVPKNKQSQESSQLPSNRPPAKLATEKEFVGDTEQRTAAYSNVREDLSTGSTHKLPSVVESRRESNVTNIPSAVQQVAQPLPTATPAKPLTEQQQVLPLNQEQLPPKPSQATVDKPQDAEVKPVVTEPKAIEDKAPISTNDNNNQAPKMVEPIVPRAKQDSVINNLAIDEQEPDLSAEQAKFVSDEAKVVLLPNDDVVLGELTEDAKIDEMPFHQYAELFEKQQDARMRRHQRLIIEHFVDNYQVNFLDNQALSNSELSELAFMAASKNDLTALRAIADSAPVLQKLDKNANTLLHIAAELGNTEIAKFLVMRGINLAAINSQGKTALMIAEQKGYSDIARLLRKAR